MSRSIRRGGQTHEGCIVTVGSKRFDDWSTAVRSQVVVLVSLLGKSCRPAVYHICYSFSKPVVAGWIVVVVCSWVCGRCRFWGWWSYCGGYIYFTLHDGRVLLPCASALCLSMLRWFLSKGTARRRNCASMRDWALCGVGPLGIRGLHRAGSRGQEVRARHGGSLPALERRAQDH